MGCASRVESEQSGPQRELSKEEQSNQYIASSQLTPKPKQRSSL
jgi:hypothetical protein